MFINSHTHHYSQDSHCVMNSMPLQHHHHQLYSCGIHPWYLDNIDEEFLALQTIALQSKCIAIGECGLDKIHMATWQTQLRVFEMQIKLANTINKPLIIHCVKAHEEVVKTLQICDNKVPTIIHGFNQNKNILAKYMKNNFYISIGTAVLKINSHAQKAVMDTPLDKLFLETDSNLEHNIGEVYTTVALLKNITMQELQLQLKRNFNTIFTASL